MENSAEDMRQRLDNLDTHMGVVFKNIERIKNELETVREISGEVGYKAGKMAIRDDTEAKVARVNKALKSFAHAAFSVTLVAGTSAAVSWAVGRRMTQPVEQRTDAPVTDTPIIGPFIWVERPARGDCHVFDIYAETKRVSVLRIPAGCQP